MENVFSSPQTCWLLPLHVLLHLESSTNLYSFTSCEQKHNDPFWRLAIVKLRSLQYMRHLSMDISVAWNSWNMLLAIFLSFSKHPMYPGTESDIRKQRFKGTNGRQKTYTVIFGITKDGSLVLNTLASWNCFTCRNLFKNGANDMSECLTCEMAYVKKFKILYISDHPILIKFRRLVVNIVIKELQMVFLTSTFINSNGNMKELERKITCEKLIFR